MKIQYNAPVILTYTIICALVLLVSELAFNIMPLFTVGGTMNFSNPVDYLRLFTHVIGHGNWSHLLGNFTFILLLGPILEEKYGSKLLLLLIVITALVTGILNIVLFNTGLLGASGVVFMFILLSSVVKVQKGKIPLTFILILILFLGKELVNIFTNDNISQFAHILGGILGAVFGFALGKKKAEVPI